MSAIVPVGIVGWDKAMMGRGVRRGRSMGSIRAGVGGKAATGVLLQSSTWFPGRNDQ